MYSVAIKPLGCHTAGMQHFNYAIRSIVFRPQNWHPRFIWTEGQRDTRQSSRRGVRRTIDILTPEGERKYFVYNSPCACVDLCVCGCASEGGVLWYDQLWWDVDSQSGSVAAGATLHRLLLSPAPLQSSNTDPTMSPQRVSGPSSLRY